MKLFSISLDCQFESDEDIKYVSSKYHLVVSDVTRFYIEQYEREHVGAVYCGPPVYVFIGSIVDIYEYVKYGYGIDMSDDEIRELCKEVKVCEI